jgi:hypothetical protein
LILACALEGGRVELHHKVAGLYGAVRFGQLDDLEVAGERRGKQRL